MTYLQKRLLIEDYYKLSIYISFIDHILSQMEFRFLKHRQILSRIQNVLPDKIITVDENEINKTIENILIQWPDIGSNSDVIIKKKALLWQRKWLGADKRPKNFIASLNACNQLMFPNIYNILKHCATIAITIATPERTFSTLKRIKTYLRNTMGENRLNGLASLSIHREINIDPKEVIQRFKEKDRRIAL